MEKVSLGSLDLRQLPVPGVSCLAQIQHLQMFVEPEAATAAFHTLMR